MIVVADIIKHYDNGLVKALNGLSFEIKRGEIVSLMGPSGCGKSTLLNLIGTLDQPTAGEIWIDGERTSESRYLNTLRAKKIGFIFQFHHLLSNLTLRENVEIPLHSLSLSRSERREKAETLLRQLNLTEKMHRFPTRVSGGERQMTAIARALANEPHIILADEPTGNIDTQTGDVILDYLIEQCRDHNMTMLVATHNHEIANKTERIIHMKNGLLE